MKTCWSMRFDCLVTLIDLLFHRILAGARACPPLARPAGSCAARASPSPSLVLFILKNSTTDSTCSPTIYFKSTCTSSLTTGTQARTGIKLNDYVHVLEGTVNCMVNCTT